MRNSNDFLVFFNSARVFINDFEDLYNPLNYPNQWEFRYLPVSALFFVPFYSLGYDWGFLMFTLTNIVLNFLISLILYKLSLILIHKSHKDKNSKIIYYVSLCLIGVPQLINYFLGQVNLYVTFLILLSLYVLIKHKNSKWQFLGSLILGLSIILKPITVFMIPFLILIDFSAKDLKSKLNLKNNFIRVFGSILPLSINFLIFYFFPTLWEDFLTTNFTGDNPVDINFSYSLTKVLSNFFVFYNIEFNQVIIFLIVVGIFGISGFSIFIIMQKNENSLLYGFFYGIIITFIGYFEVWEHHLVNLIPLLVLIYLNMPSESKISKKFIKPSIFFYSFLSVAFLGLFVLIYPFFPYNFGDTIILILNFYGLSKYCLSQRRNKLKE